MIVQYICKKQLKSVAYGLRYVWFVDMDCFYEPDFDNLSEKMRFAYEFYDEVKLFHCGPVEIGGGMLLDFEDSGDILDYFKSQQIKEDGRRLRLIVNNSSHS